MSVFEGSRLACIRGGRKVFSGLDFAVGAGEVLWLKGPNGSGKTSLLRLMAGLLAPASGDVVWNGTRVAEDPEAHAARLHYQGHRDAVKPALTVAENLGFWASFRGADGNPDDRAGEALRRFGLAPFADVPGRLLSAGQKRRLSLARLLATPAELWLLDEPAASLDEEARRTLLDAIEQHRTAGGVTVFATHAGLSLEETKVLDLLRFVPPSAAAWMGEGQA